MQKMEQAVFGGGCFWCIEAMFQKVKGVQQIENGYTGGKNANPTYKDICTGTTEHAEVCRVTFDNSILQYKEIIELFFYCHDPTQLNKQDNDVGTQYRSCIYALSDEQLKQAKEVKEQVNKEVFSGKVVTTLEMLGQFYKAEDYHQNYFNLNANANPYCQFVVAKKVQKFINLLNSKNMDNYLS